MTAAINSNSQLKGGKLERQLNARTLNGLRDNVGRTDGMQLPDIAGGSHFDKVSHIEASVPQSSWGWKAMCSGGMLAEVFHWPRPHFAPINRYRKRAGGPGERESRSRFAVSLHTGVQVERLGSTRTHPSSIRRGNAAYFVSGLYTRQTNDFCWQVWIKRADFAGKRTSARVCGRFCPENIRFRNVPDRRSGLVWEDRAANANTYGSIAVDTWHIRDGFEHLRASGALLTAAACIDLPPFESSHVRLLDVREKWELNKLLFE